jgi:3'(2'), 5'-bisphosphate nucleotidase
MNHLSSEQLDKVAWIVHHYGRQVISMASQEFQVLQKGVDDYVTSVDHWLDEQLSREIEALFPQDGLITEENTPSRQAFQQTYQRLWLVDPLDGTDDFIHRKKHYAVMVGTLEEHQPQAGWIYAPAFDHLYYGRVGQGLFQMQGDRPALSLVPLEPPPPSPYFCPILIGPKDQRQYGQAIQQEVPQAQFRTIGSFGLKVMEVICGRAGLYLYCNRRVKLWDTTAPIALAQAAGLVCCDLAGNPLDFSSTGVDAETLVHHQTMVIGWPSYVETLRSHLWQAIRSR